MLDKINKTETLSGMRVIRETLLDVIITTEVTSKVMVNLDMSIDMIIMVEKFSNN